MHWSLVVHKNHLDYSCAQFVVCHFTKLVVTFFFFFLSVVVFIDVDFNNNNSNLLAAI